MLSIPPELAEALQNTDIKTVERYARLYCKDCKKKYFLSLMEYRAQVDDNSDNNWRCPKCGGHECMADFSYAYRMLAQ